MDENIHSFFLSDQNVSLLIFNIILFVQNLIKILFVVEILDVFLIFIFFDLEQIFFFVDFALNCFVILLLCNFLFFNRMEPHSLFAYDVLAIQLLLIDVEVFLHNVISNLADETNTVNIVFEI